jgi:hypothetical protein
MEVWKLAVSGGGCCNIASSLVDPAGGFECYRLIATISWSSSEIQRKVLACDRPAGRGSEVKIRSDEAFLVLHKWQVELTPVLFVGSLMPSHPLRGLIAVVTREGVWNSGDEPASIWGFHLTGEKTSFLASKFEDFEYLRPAELPPNIKMSLPEIARERDVLALTKTMKLVNTARTEGDALVPVRETLFLVEDDLHTGRNGPS